MTLTASLLQAALQIPGPRASLWTPAIAQACWEYGVDTPLRVSMFLAQYGHETDRLAELSENLDYSESALLTVDGMKQYFTHDNVQDYAHIPSKIGARAYANRMGNGDEVSGDGYTFRGRGLPMLTGRAAYQEFGAAVGFDIVGAPDLLTTPGWAAKAGGWYWKTRGLNAFADVGNVAGATRHIDGGLNGLDHRQQLFTQCCRAFGVTAPAPADPGC